MVKVEELNQDQKRVILVLGDPSEFFRGFHTTAAIRGVPYKKITQKSGLTVEKVLLSIGWLEAIGLVDHDVAVVRKSLDYLGQTNIEVTGQSVVRMFYLTETGLEALEAIKKSGVIK
ncbi:MAG: hypothetical protein ACXAB2_08825 [Candidatus Hodarchaeales archaeon]|jgi:hypothetical protein